jgi:MarR family transcriptional regulator, organic hydroperoxide resistance regulator
MAVSKDPGAEAWELMFELFRRAKRERLELSQEFGLSPMQLVALTALEPGAEVPTSSLTETLLCDASNVTGIVDRLEGRGLIERRAAAHDRRVKLLALTDEGSRLLEEATRRTSRPPRQIAELSGADKRALRDILKRAVAQREMAAV